MGPADLAQVLRQLQPVRDPNVLVGHDTGDDAAVYRLTDELAVVQSVDLFPPVVDDPYAFGAIAAANALSDIYAMGARPLFALSVVGFPLAKLKLEVLAAILKGGQDKAHEAGIDIVGGHSIDDVEPKYGLVVTGVVHPARVLRNHGAKRGDVLVVTKPIGTGVLTTAIKAGRLDAETTEIATRAMATLNRQPAEALDGLDVHAWTDITGFGLLGHLRELVVSSGVSARVHMSDVPLLPHARELAAQNAFPGGSRRNLVWVEELLTVDATVARSDLLLLADAQTSGGLLVALSERDAAEFLDRIAATDYPLEARAVGEVTGERAVGTIEPGAIEVTP